MIISHELPLSLTQYGYIWNQYDYCLPIFLDHYDEYLSYFKKARLDRRFIIMDNSLFEGYNHTTEDLIDKINLITPNIFVVPDKWNDSEATINNAEKWITQYKPELPEEVNLMAVCQGQDINELISTYQILINLGYKHIAFNHSSAAYRKEYNESIPDLKAQMYGRIEFIRRLVEKDIIKPSNYHHLLGSSDWHEFQSYIGLGFIKSVDTSAPIINGALGIRLNYDEKYTKPKEKLEDIMKMDLTDKMDIIQYNVNEFKKFTKF